MNGTSSGERLSPRPYFDRTMTLYIKGIALICMLVHHFFTFPERYIPGIDYAYVDLFARIFQAPTRICVSTFAFLTGYFYFYNKKKTLAYSLKKDYQLLISYWVAYLLLLGLVFLAGVSVSPENILQEMLTLRKDIMVDSWYVQFYLLAMLLLPLLVRLLPRQEAAAYLVGLGLPVIFFTLVADHSPLWLEKIALTQRQWFTSIMSGYLVARHDLFARVFDPARDRFRKSWQKALFGLVLMGSGMLLRRFFTYGIFGLVLLSRNIAFQMYMDVFYAPMFIYGTVVFLQNVPLFEWMKKILAAVGRLSLPMWFAHGLFFGIAKEFYQPIAFLPGNPILVLIWGGFLSFLLAWCIDKITALLLRRH